MYQALSEFLKTFSAQFPILWALLVTLTVAATGIAMYGFWEITLKGLSVVSGRRSESRGETQR